MDGALDSLTWFVATCLCQGVVNWTLLTVPSFQSKALYDSTQIPAHEFTAHSATHQCTRNRTDTSGTAAHRHSSTRGHTTPASPPAAAALQFAGRTPTPQRRDEALSRAPRTAKPRSSHGSPPSASAGHAHRPALITRGPGRRGQAAHGRTLLEALSPPPERCTTSRNSLPSSRKLLSSGRARRAAGAAAGSSPK